MTNHKFVLTYDSENRSNWVCRGCRLGQDWREGEVFKHFSVKPTRRLLKNYGYGLNCEDELVRRVMHA